MVFEDSYDDGGQFQDPNNPIGTRSMNVTQDMMGMSQWRTNTEDDIHKYEAMLLGKIYNAKLKRYEAPPSGSPVMRMANEKFVAWARLMLQSAINKNNILGNINSDQLGELVYHYACTIIEHIGSNYEYYEVDKNKRKTVIDTLVFQVYLVLTRPVDDKERDHSTKVSRESVIQRIGELMPRAPMQKIF